MEDLDLGPVKEALRLTGRSPARHGTVVRAIRRVLWPFIRPYHFVSLEWTRDRLLEVRRAIDALGTPAAAALAIATDQPAEADPIERLEAHINARVDERVNRDIVNVSFRQSTLRAEVIAVGRQLDEWRSRVEAAEAAVATVQDHAGRVSDFGERISASEKSAVALHQELTEASQTLSNLSAHVRDLAGMIGQNRETMNATEARMTDTYERHRNSVSLRLQQIEHRLAVLASGKPDSEASPFATVGAAAFELGEATFFESQFGPLILRPGDLITRHILQTGAWDAHMAEAIHKGAGRGRVAVDAGAHFGVISCWMATLFDTVHAFEANRETYVFLCANAALREPGRIQPHNVALWSVRTTLSLANVNEQDISIATDRPLESAFRAADNVGSFSFAPDGTGVNAIEARPIDEFRLENVGFMKIDCQGADGHVIKGALDTIRRCRPIVVFEWETFLSAPRGITLDEVNDLFDQIGYEVKPLYMHNEKQVDYIASPKDASSQDAPPREARP